MVTREEFGAYAQAGVKLLDGATGSNLRKAGMPSGCSAELWVLEHREAILSLQRSYREAGSDILYAPSFLAQPLELEKYGKGHDTEKINEQLALLCREAAGSDCLVAGDLATMAATVESFDEANFDQMVADYRRQIRGLLDGGADFLAAETLLYPQEAEAILAAAELEGGPAVLYSFTMQPDGSLFSGRDALPVLQDLEHMGAAAVGLNCVPASSFLPGTVARFRRGLKGPLSVKPNAGDPVIGPDKIAVYPMGKEEFAAIARDMAELGANLIGGCCGTDPSFIRAVKEALARNG